MPNVRRAAVPNSGNSRGGGISSHTVIVPATLTREGRSIVLADSGWAQSTLHQRKVEVSLLHPRLEIKPT